ncbi:hypothetical protein FVW20_00580 [Desulfovibrio oxamicus]|uniref:Uncharacterized protein n=1 Tax=Nitratidesulfovibrio oxamicus TaxID=32016 RepID=A0ABS0IZE9_9BACT|nr:hypothetical protein [Nitratidesulfovibrio oxamicus]MBG3875559.1 hypothetical protein [Nitratidesulfovibrio oxamicus]
MKPAEIIESLRNKSRGEGSTIVGRGQLRILFEHADYCARAAEEVREICRELQDALSAYMAVCNPADPNPVTDHMAMYVKAKAALQSAEKVL